MIQPLHDLIAVLPAPVQESKDGFQIAQVAQTRPKEGTVIAVGPGKYAANSGVLIPMSSQVGDKILYSKYSGGEVEVDGVKYLLMRDEEVLAII